MEPPFRLAAGSAAPKGPADSVTMRATPYRLTQGQPWLVNALAHQLTDRLVTDRGQAITAASVEEAKEILIRRQYTHLGSLMDRLRETRVRAVLAPMLAGSTPGDVPEDDRRFVLDLGLLRRSPLGGVEVANPIYREIIVRALAGGPSDSLPRIPATWLTAEGKLDKDALLREGSHSSTATWRRWASTRVGSSPSTAGRTLHP